MHLLLNSLSLKEQSPRDLGSPGDRQLLQVQPFSPNFLKFWAPPHDLALFLNRRILELIGRVLISNDCVD